MKYLPTKIY